MQTQDKIQHKSEKELDRGFNELKEKQRKIDNLHQKIKDEKLKSEQEKKEIIISFEREIQSQNKAIIQKSDMKLKTLKQVNDNLNVKLKEYRDVEQKW